MRGGNFPSILVAPGVSRIVQEEKPQTVFDGYKSLGASFSDTCIVLNIIIH